MSDRSTSYRSTVLADELVAVVEGPFDGGLAPRVHADLCAAFDSGVRHVVVDLCEATVIDDGAIAVVAAATVTAVNGGGHLYVALGADRVVEISDPSLVRAVFERELH